MDLTAVRAPGSPVYLDITGQIGLFSIRAHVESALAQALNDRDLAPAVLIIRYPELFSTRIVVSLVTRTTSELNTGQKVAGAVSQSLALATGFPTDAANVTRIGASGEIVATDTGAGSWLDRIIAWLTETFGTVGIALKWAAILIIIGAVVWLAIRSGALSTFRAEFA